MNQGQALYKLQEIDLSILHTEKRLIEIKAELEDNAAVQAAQAQVNKAEAVLKPLQVNLRDLENQMSKTREKRQRTEQRLYSGTVTNPKELQDMQQEIEALKRWLLELEERTLEAMMTADEAKNILETAQSNLNTVTEQAAAENQDLLAEKQQLESQLVQLREQRQQAAQKVTAENLALYEKLRKPKANRPVSYLKPDDTCSACGIRQTDVIARLVRRGDELVRCINCQRILVDL